MVDKDILERIRKLLAKAESSRTIGELGEAESLTAKATEMLTRYNLSLSDVERAEGHAIGEEKYRPEEHGFEMLQRSVVWERALASTVAELNFCKTLYYTGSNEIAFIGREENRKVAVQIFVMIRRALARACEELYSKEYRRLYSLGPIYAKQVMGNNWKQSFRFGCIYRVEERLQALRTNIDQETGGKLSGLIHLSGAEVDNYLASLKVRDGGETFWGEGINVAAMAAGRRFADSIPLSPAVEGMNNQAKGGRLLA